MYFKKVSVNDEVYSIVYGSGKVCFVVDKKSRMSGFYSFEVKYETGHRVFYTDDGIPNWCSSPEGEQTVWYKKDIDLINEDFTPSVNELNKKKILKLKLKNKLEMKNPSGIWRNVEISPEREFINAISKEQFHLFRKAEHE